MKVTYHLDHVYIVPAQFRSVTKLLRCTSVYTAPEQDFCIPAESKKVNAFGELWNS